MAPDDAPSEWVEGIPRDPSAAQLAAAFEELPPRDDRSWELHLTRLVEQRVDVDGAIEEIRRDSERFSDGQRFAAVFTRATHLRRNHSASRLDVFLEEHAEFEERPMFTHLCALAEKEKGNLDAALDYARDVADAYDRHAGIQHALASIHITIAEASNDIGDDRVEKASEALDVAITEDPDYPKFRATRARLLLLDGEYEAAKESVEQAIDTEDENKKDYALRLGYYQRLLSRIQFQRQLEVVEAERDTLEERFKARLESAREEQRAVREELEADLRSAEEQIHRSQTETEKMVRGLQTQTLQFLGFFATLLAVIITSVQLATSFQVAGAAALILVLVGGLLCAFAGFSLLLPEDPNAESSRARISSAIFACGVVVVLLGGYFAVVVG